MELLSGKSERNVGAVGEQTVLVASLIANTADLRSLGITTANDKSGQRVPLRQARPCVGSVSDDITP